MPMKTVYDVLHDIKCHQEWDTDVIDTHDIIQLAANADVGYCAWRCLKPWKHRDLVTLRSGQVEDGYRAVINFSIKHPVVKNLRKAWVKYPAWKQQHDANVKPRPCPEQNTLRLLVLSELALQRAALLENVDESSPSETKDEKGEHSSSEKWFTVRSGGNFYKKISGFVAFSVMK